MAEEVVGPCPQGFVVDTCSNYESVPGEKKPMRARAGVQFLLVVLGLFMLGLVVQGFFIYTLYKKMELLSHERSHPYYLNLSSPASGQQGGTIMGQVGSKDLNDIPMQPPYQKQVQQTPFAHLIGSNSPAGEDNVVQWTHDSGDAITYNMSYDKGRLVVKMEGYYYLYSKVQLNAASECSLIQHRVMKDTSAYGQSIELMRSKSFRCRTQKMTTSNPEYLWNSFLAGIFHLQRGDHIFVKLENMQKIRPGSTDNFMGAFMIHP